MVNKCNCVHIISRTRLPTINTCIRQTTAWQHDDNCWHFARWMKALRTWVYSAPCQRWIIWQLATVALCSRYFTKFARLPKTGLPHKLAGFGVSDCFQLAANLNRILQALLDHTLTNSYHSFALQLLKIFVLLCCVVDSNPRNLRLVLCQLCNS